MSANTIFIQYQQMEKLAGRFEQRATGTRALQKRLNAHVEVMKRGAWQSGAADEFYNDISQNALPALTRLANALDKAAGTLREIARIFKAAEEEGRAIMQQASGDTSEAAVQSGLPTASQFAATVVSGSGTWSDYLGLWWDWLTGKVPAIPSPVEVPQVLPSENEIEPLYPPHGSEESTQADRDHHDRMRQIASAAQGGRPGTGRGPAPLAGRMLDHYLDNTGETYNLSANDVDYIMEDVPYVNRMIIRENAENSLKQQIKDRLAREYNGQPMEFEVRTNWESADAMGSDTRMALAGFSYSQTATVRVTAGPNGPVVTMYSQEHILDRYDFPRGSAATINIPSSGVDVIDRNTIAGDVISNTEMRRLHTTGLAREFDVRGSGAVKRTTYDYNQQPGVTPIYPET